MNIIIIMLGVAVRLRHYLENRSFWLNEAWLAVDISIRTFGEIVTARLASHDLPVVPPGFAVIEKVSSGLFGYNEYAFRLFPLMSGIVSLVFFYKILKKYVDRKVVPLALGLFCFSDILIYHSSEVKQYSSGVMIVLILYLVMRYIDDSPKITVVHSVLYGLTGAVATLMYYPSVFILAGIGSVQIFEAIHQKNRERTEGLLFSAFCWVVNFIMVYLVFFMPMLHDPTIAYGMSNFTQPYPIWSLNALGWMVNKIINIFLNETVGLPPFWIAVYFFMIGIFSSYWVNPRRCLVFLLPIIFLFLAIGFKKYTMEARLLVGLIPGFLIILAKGLTSALWCKKRPLRILNVILACIIMIYPIRAASQSFVKLYSREEIRPLMEYLKQNQLPGDALVINNSAQYVYGFYLGNLKFDHRINPFIKISDALAEDEAGENILLREEFYNFDEKGRFHGIDRFGDLAVIYKDAVNPFGENKRTWILFAHVPEVTKNFILSLLGQDGVLLKKLEQPGAYLYLYDLSGSG